MPQPQEVITELIVKKNQIIKRGREESGSGREGVVSSGSSFVL